MFIDIERVSGRQEAPPLSIALVKVVDQKIVECKEVVIVPAGNSPNKWDYNCKNIHKMYVENVGGNKVVKKMVVGGKDVVLPSLPPAKAAGVVVDFLTNCGDNVSLVYHGEDEKCLLPFLEQHNVIHVFNDVVSSLIDSRVFFKIVQKPFGRKFGMKTVVEDWGDKEDKKEYLMGAHGALVDARVLAKICTGPQLGERFGHWIDFEQMLLM